MTTTEAALRADDLVQLRQSAGMKAKELADLLDISPEHLSRMENGEKPISRVMALAVRTILSQPPASSTVGEEDGLFTQMIDAILSEWPGGAESIRLFVSSEGTAYWFRPEQLRALAQTPAHVNWKSLALEAIECVKDACRETSWGQPTFGPSFGEELEQQAQRILSPSSGEPASVAAEADVNQVADIIAAKVSGPGYREETFKMAHRLDQLEAARHIIAALSKPTPVEAGLREALTKAATVSATNCMESGGRKVIVYFDNKGDDWPLFNLLSDLSGLATPATTTERGRG